MIKIRNFRKLKDVTIDLQADTTLFIGANNSGKTSAITAIKSFLDSERFSHYDFSLSNHIKINELFSEKTEPSEQDFNDIFPVMDLWFHVEDEDIHHVSHLLPTLDWVSGDLGIRIRYEIRNISMLYNEYQIIREKVKNKKTLFPVDMMDYLSKYLSKHFEIRRYLLDPNEMKAIQEQETLGDALDGNPLNNIVLVNTINAQRGMSDEVSDAEQMEKRKLSALMMKYYDLHLDSNKGEMTEKDIEALTTLQEAMDAFTTTMRTNFIPRIAPRAFQYRIERTKRTQL